MKNEFQPFVGIVKDLAWSPDNQRIVAVGEGREKFGHVFATETGTSVGEIAGHSKVINSCDFRPSRPFRIVTGSEDASIGIYEGPPFKFKTQIQDHTRFVQAIRYSPSGDCFASAGFDGKLFIYNSSDYSKISELGSPAHKGGIYAISWSPDGKKLLSASGDKTSKIWDISTGQVITEFILGSDVLDQQVSCLWQDPYLLSVSLSGFINYLDVNNPDRPLRVIKGHNKSITSLANSKLGDDGDNEYLFTGSHDGYITRWSCQSGEHDRVGGSQHTNQVQDMVAADGDNIYTCALDDTIRVLDPRSNKFLADFEPLKLTVQPKGIAKFGAHLIIAGSNELQVFEDRELKSSSKIRYEPSSVDVLPSLRQVAVGGSSDDKVHIYTISENFQLEEIKCLEHRGCITDVKYSPDGNYLAASDSNRKIVLYKTNEEYSEAHDKEWGFHTAKVNCLAWSPDSEILVSGGLDTNLIAWFPKEPTRHIIKKHAHPQSQITRISFISKRSIASSGQDATVRIWNILEEV